MKNKKLKVAIYCRSGKNDQLGIAKQEKTIKKFCEENNYNIFKIYKDIGYTSKEHRPSYNNMLKDLKNNKFDLLLIYRLDRLHRSIPKLEFIKSIADDHQCIIRTIKEDIDTSNAAGTMFFRMLGIIEEMGLKTNV